MIGTNFQPPLLASFNCFSNVVGGVSILTILYSYSTDFIPLMPLIPPIGAQQESACFVAQPTNNNPANAIAIRLLNVVFMQVLDSK